MSDVIEAEVIETTEVAPAADVAGTHLAKIGASMPVPQQPSEAAVISMIDRAARDPSVDIDKMQQLLALRQQIEDRQAKRDWHDAMTQAQSEMRAVKKNMTNSSTKSKYASYDKLDEAARPYYSKYGLCPTFDTGESPLADHVRILCDVSRGGYTRQYHLDMPADGKGAKGGDVMTKTHATGSALAYGKRYLLCMIFNLTTTDDDGNAAGAATAPISDEQVKMLQALVVATKSDITQFLKLFKAESLPDIREDKYYQALGMLKAKEAKQQTKEQTK